MKTARFLLLLILMMGALPAFAAGGGDVNNIRFGGDANKTRLVFDITSPSLAYVAKILTGPDRLVVDIQGRWLASRNVTISKNHPMIEKVDHSTLGENLERLTVFFKRPVRIEKQFVLEKSPRIVIDLVPALANDRGLSQPVREITPPAAGIPKNQSKTDEIDQLIENVIAHPAPKPRPNLPNRKYTVVIDAGHGGVDPGAISVTGVYEKDIALAAARELKAALEKTGRYKVVMTRDRDVFLKLRSRINIARKAGADLFISIHADSHPDRNVRGTSVYTLSENASDAEAERLARQENKADLIGGVDLSGEDTEVSTILLDLAQRETLNYSAFYAQKLVNSLAKRVNLLRRTHRFAGFVVLKSPDVPSILLEMGYLSNKQDSNLLKQPSHRQKIVSGVVEATNTFFDWRESLQRL